MRVLETMVTKTKLPNYNPVFKKKMTKSAFVVYNLRALIRMSKLKGLIYVEIKFLAVKLVETLTLPNSGL